MREVQPVGSAATRAVRAGALRPAVREAGFRSVMQSRAAHVSTAAFIRAPDADRWPAWVRRSESAPAVAYSIDRTAKRMSSSHESVRDGNATPNEQLESAGPEVPALVRWD